MSSIGWTQIYRDVDGEPIRAIAGPLHHAAVVADNTARFIGEITADFRAFSRLEHQRFDGAAVQALASTITEVGTSLDGVEPVFRRLATILRNHGGAIERHRSDAKVALARARTAWVRKQDAEGRQDAAISRYKAEAGHLSNAQRQIARWTETLNATPPDDAGHIVIRDHLRQWHQTAEEHRRAQSRAANDRDQAQRDRNDAEAELEYWRRGRGNSRSWESLRNAEDVLNAATARGIDGIDLRKLADPSWLERTLGVVDGFLFDSEFSRFITAVVQGDVDVLREYLETVFKVVAVVALAAILVVAAVYLAPIVLPLLAKAAAGVSAWAAKSSLAMNAAFAWKVWKKGSKVASLAELASLLYVRHQSDNPAVRRQLQDDFEAKSLDLIRGEITGAVVKVGSSKELGLVNPKLGAVAPGLVDAGGYVMKLSGGRSEPEGAVPLISPPELPMPRTPSELLQQQRHLYVTDTPSDLGQLQPYVCTPGGGR